MPMPRRSLLRSLLAAPAAARAVAGSLTLQLSGTAVPTGVLFDVTKGLAPRLGLVGVPAVGGYDPEILASAAGTLVDPLAGLRHLIIPDRPLTHPAMQAQIDAGFATLAALDAPPAEDPSS